MIPLAQGWTASLASEWLTTIEILPGGDDRQNSLVVNKHEVVLRDPDGVARIVLPSISDDDLLERMCITLVGIRLPETMLDSMRGERVSDVIAGFPFEVPDDLTIERAKNLADDARTFAPAVSLLLSDPILPIGMPPFPVEGYRRG